ncbi:MAG TPA: hypothetical protein VL995_03575 [Cellvibrio sp.]|nr:hypothetical protein [Cellvibrio sp.]
MHSKGIHFSLALIASMGFISLTGCGGGDNNSERIAQAVDASKNTVTKIAIASNEQYVHFKGFYQFELIGSDDQGNPVNLTSKATWKISDPTLGTIKNGLFTASGTAGNFVLTAEYAGLVSAAQDINVSDANLVEVTVVHPTANVDECKNTTLSAKALFSNGKVLPYDLTWAVTSGSNASFKDKNRAILSTTNAGTITVVASGEDNNGVIVPSAAINIEVADTLTGVTVAVDKSSTELRNGDETKVKVSGTYAGSTDVIDITDNATLTADPTRYLKIAGSTITAQDGTVSGSSVTLIGDCGGVKGEQKLTVKDREVKSIDIFSPDSSTLNVVEGDDLNLNARATFVDNSTQSDDYTDVTWDIEYGNNFPEDKENLITISANGLLEVDEDLNEGNITITVTVEVKGTDIKDEVPVTITAN